MTFIVISPSQVAAKAPLDDQLLGDIKTDLDDLNSRVTNSGGGTASVDQLAEKLDLEHYGLKTQQYPQSLSDSFKYKPPAIVGWMPYNPSASATTLKLIWNVLFLKASNPNFDGTTGWAVLSGTDASNITTSVTHTIGTNSLSWDKAGGINVLSGIYLDLGAGNEVNVSGHREFLIQQYLPSISNFASFRLRVSADPSGIPDTNYREITITNDVAGIPTVAAAFNWNLYTLTDGTGVSVGTGWSTAQPIRSIALIVETSSAGQTYLGILADAAAFNIDTYKNLAQLGDEFTLHDNSLQENMIIATTSPVLRGIITLDSALAHSYLGGSQGFVKRSSSLQLGNSETRFQDGLSGTIDTLQTVRIKRILPTSVSSKNFALTVQEGNPLFLYVDAVTSSTQFNVADPNNIGVNQYKNTDRIWVFQQFDNNGKLDFRLKTEVGNNGLLTMSADSTYSAPDLTITNGGTNVGISVGDIIIKDDMDVRASVVPLATKETFGSRLVQTDILLSSLGIAFPPGLQSFWPMNSGSGGEPNTRATTGYDLTQNGIVPTGVGKITAASRGPFSSSNYFNWPAASSTTTVFDSLTQLMGCWIKLGAGGITQAIAGKAGGGTGAGTYFYVDSSNFLNFLVGSGSAQNIQETSVNLFDSNWHYVVAVYNQGVSNGTRLYIDNVKVASITVTNALVGSVADFYVGYIVGGSPSPFSGQIESFEYWNTLPSYADIEAAIAARWNAGNGANYGYGSIMDHRYAITNTTGQKLSMKVDFNRRNDSISPSSARVGMI